MDDNRQQYLESMSWRAIAAIMLVLAEFGMLAPALVSAPSTLMVLLGFGSMAVTVYVLWRIVISCMRLKNSYEIKTNQTESQENA